MLDYFNDGSRNAPRLRVGQALWSLIGLPHNCGPDGKTEWSLDEKFALCHEVGFESIECWLDDNNEQEVADTSQRYGLKLILGHRPFTLDDTRSVVERAKRVNADFTVAHLAHSFVALEEATQLFVEGRKIANAAGLPLFVETHRNTFAETILQTNRLIGAVPDIGITGDFSHFVVGGEIVDGPEVVIERLSAILPRVQHLHGRVSNGEAVQVDIGDGTSPLAQFFVEIWASAMKHWLKDAHLGDIFQFTSELGPPNYAITLPDGREFSDRWAQSLVLKGMAETAWQKARQA